MTMKRRLNPEYVAGILRRTKNKLEEDLSPEELDDYCDRVVEALERIIAEDPDSYQVMVEVDVPGVTPKTSMKWFAQRYADFYVTFSEEEIPAEKRARLLNMSIEARFEDLKKEVEPKAPFSNLTIKRAKRIQRISQLIIDELLELDQLGKLRFIDGHSSMSKGALSGINDPIF